MDVLCLNLQNFVLITQILQNFVRPQTAAKLVGEKTRGHGLQTIHCIEGKTFESDTLIRDSIIWCKLSVGIDASQLCPYPMCQAMPTGP